MSDLIEIIARGLAVAHGADPDLVITAQRPLQLVPANGELPPPPFEGVWWKLWERDAQAVVDAISAAGLKVVAQ